MKFPLSNLSCLKEMRINSLKQHLGVLYNSSTQVDTNNCDVNVREDYVGHNNLIHTDTSKGTYILSKCTFNCLIIRSNSQKVSWTQNTYIFT